MNSKECTTADSFLMNNTMDLTPSGQVHPQETDAPERNSRTSRDLLSGFGCAACAMLMAALAFATKSALIVMLSAAGTLLLSIRVFLVQEPASRKRRKLMAYLLYLPLTAVSGLLGLHTLLADLLSPINQGLEFGDLCALIVFYVPGNLLLMLFGSHYAAKQKRYPAVLLILMYLVYALFQADAFRLAFFVEELTAGSLWYSGYARTGFLELCILTAVDLAVIHALNRCVRSGRSTRPKLLNGLAAVLCIYHIFITATAIAQIIVYIRCCGLTQMRICAIVISGLIAAVFLVLFLRQLLKKVPAAS